jgi:hypothetical protein
VKCDETKPSCNRCAKFGRVCDGYIVKKISNPSSKPRPKTQPLVPLILAPRTISCPPRVPIKLLFSDEQEERFFRIFHEETAGALSGGFDTPLWNRIVLQACQDEPCILHCAVAISALDKACKVKSLESLAHTSETHHRYALQQYSKALQGVREVILKRESPLRTALIASLLIFCFENFHGDVRLALTNVQSSVDLLHSWLASNIGPEVPKGFSPRPQIIEDDLVLAFARLDVHLMSWIDTPQPSRTSILDYAVTEPAPIPAHFSSLLEAKTSFEHVVNRLFKYLAQIKRIKNEVHASLHNRVYDEDGIPFIEPPVSIELKSWMTAHVPVLSAARKPTGAQDFVGALTLRIHALTLLISLRSVFFDDGVQSKAHDVFLPEYCEIVALAREVSCHPNFVKSFVFDAGIVPSLFVVVTKCGDQMVRREAINILRVCSPRREGVWDALMVARIAEEVERFGDELEMKTEGGNREEGMHNRWVEIHLTCLSTTFALPAPPDDENKEGRAARSESRKYLLDWVERSMKLDVVSEEPRYGRHIIY